MGTTTNDESAELYAELDALAGSRSAVNPVNTFIKNAKAQIAKIDDLLTDLGAVDSKLVPQSDWFFRDGGGWVVKYGRAKFKTPNGSDWFKAKDLEHVKRIINIGIKLAEIDSGFQNQIRDAGKKEKATPSTDGEAPKRRGRKAKA